MAIYDSNNNVLNYCYTRKGTEAIMAYDINNNVVHYKEYDTPHIKNRICVFEDYFTGNALDTTKWENEIGYCRNNELQHYRPENAIIADGKLNLKAIRGHYSGDVYRGSEWTSASITTNNKFEAFYGRWQVKAKFAKLAGSFGAIWLLGEGCEFKYRDDGKQLIRTGPTGWTECGEIDIHECLPGNAGQMHSGIWKYPSGMSVTGSYGIDISEWHIYEMEWTESEITFMVDGKKCYDFDLTSDTEFAQYILSGNAVQNGFYLILNQAVGAGGGTPSNDVMEMDMFIDWVRIYAPINYTEEMIHAKSISIDSTLEMQVGGDVNMFVTWNPDATFDRTTHWVSSDETVATVHSGRIKGISAGTATITCTTNNGKSAQCIVNVI